MPRPAADRRLRIGVVEKNQNPYWEMVNAGWADAAAALSLDLDIRAPQSEDLEEQRRLMLELIDAGIDGLAFVGTRRDAFDDIAAIALERGVRVVTFDLDSAVDHRSMFVGMGPSVGMGRQLGELIAARVPVGSTVVLQTGSDKAPGASGKLAGLLEVLGERGIAAVAGASDREDAEESRRIAGELLEAYPEASAMAGVYGYHPAIQAAAAAAAGRAPLIFGFDMLPETVELLESGAVEASIWIGEYYFGYYTAVALHDMIRLGDDSVLGLYGMSTDDRSGNVLVPPTRVFTPDNVAQFVAWSDAHDLSHRVPRMQLNAAS
jgi:ribose transport system substrate-binding protein